MTNPQIKYYDPSEMVRGIQQLLVSDKKKIAFLFGDGTQSARRDESMPFIPPISEITKMIEAEVAKNSRYASAVWDIKTELENSPDGFSLETLLANIEDKVRIIGSQTLNNLRKEDFVSLSTLIRGMLSDIISVHQRIDDSNAKSLVHYDFAGWVKNADKKQAVEIFTTNYDYLFEIGFEEMELPYYDGFSGSYRPFFNPVSLTDMNYLKSQTKLWKVNGSLGLSEIVSGSTNPRIYRSGSSFTSASDLLIYSSAQKYSNSKKSPYAAYLDRLYYFLKQPDAVLFICGYGFNNEHINERMLSAINVSSLSHVFVFYDDTAESGNPLTDNNPLARIALNNRRFTVLGTKDAIIGCSRGKWRLKREPDSKDADNMKIYFDYETQHLTVSEISGEKVWAGEGELKLHDFTHFVDFLKTTIPKNEWEG